MTIELDDAALSDLEASLLELKRSAEDTAGKAGALLAAIKALRAGSTYVSTLSPVFLMEMKAALADAPASYGAGNRITRPFVIARSMADPDKAVNAMLAEIRHGLPEGEPEHYLFLVDDETRAFGAYLAFCRTDGLSDNALIAAGRVLRQELEDGSFAARRPSMATGQLLPANAAPGI